MNTRKRKRKQSFETGSTGSLVSALHASSGTETRQSHKRRCLSEDKAAIEDQIFKGLTVEHVAILRAAASTNAFGDLQTLQRPQLNQFSAEARAYGEEVFLACCDALKCINDHILTTNGQSLGEGMPDWSAITREHPALPSRVTFMAACYAAHVWKVLQPELRNPSSRARQLAEIAWIRRQTNKYFTDKDEFFSLDHIRGMSADFNAATQRYRDSLFQAYERAETEMSRYFSDLLGADLNAYSVTPPNFMDFSLDSQAMQYGDALFRECRQLINDVQAAEARGERLTTFAGTAFTRRALADLNDVRHPMPQATAHPYFNADDAAWLMDDETTDLLLTGGFSALVADGLYSDSKPSVTGMFADPCRPNCAEAAVSESKFGFDRRPMS